MAYLFMLDIEGDEKIPRVDIKNWITQISFLISSLSENLNRFPNAVEEKIIRKWNVYCKSIFLLS